MKDNRHLKTAIQYGIKEQCEKLEKDLLSIDGIIDIDFDLDGFYDNLGQVIFLAKYDAGTSFYEKIRLKSKIIDICTLHGLYPSGDLIEDYGHHFYFVRNCGKVWERI